MRPRLRKLVDPQLRIRELEAEVARLQAEREYLRTGLQALAQKLANIK